jgi:hypothetical protein
MSDLKYIGGWVPFWLARNPGPPPTFETYMAVSDREVAGIKAALARPKTLQERGSALRESPYR